MTIEAAKTLASFAERKGLSEDYIIPNMTEREVFPEVATAVALKAIEQGVARIKMSKDEIYEEAKRMITSAQEKVQKLMELGFIAAPPS